MVKDPYDFKDLDFKDDFKNDKEFKEFEDYNFERKPSNDTYDTFRLRTDPEQLLINFELRLRNQYIIKHRDGREEKRQIPNTTPLCNEQGIQEILIEIKSIINNHTVQGNQSNINEHRLRLREIADDLTIFFWSSFEDWGLPEKQVNVLINSAYWLIDLFLTRTLDNKERELYGETYKENTQREVKNDKGRNGFLGIPGAINRIIAR